MRRSMIWKATVSTLFTGVTLVAASAGAAASEAGARPVSFTEFGTEPAKKTALRAQTPNPSAANPLTGQMRLGVFGNEPPKRRGPVAVVTPRSNCLKWRRIAERLGETFAGLRLRQSVVDRACLFAESELYAASNDRVGREPHFAHLWAWPWAQGAIDPELPPRLHATYGDWSIRCGNVGPKERCALIHETSAASAQDVAAASGSTKVTTHFVIDTIGGQSQVLWRVFAARRSDGWFVDGAAASPTNSQSPHALVRFTAGALTGAKRFDGCSAAGCLMEADVTSSARVATRLWEGGGADITLSPADGLTMTAPVSSNGFRSGLGELGRLKRAEDNVIARNEP
jgi:invasion protein IalB